ncbi:MULTISPECIES: STAS domain-containing protein [unclassified Streptomyces]|uniref:STAS domain-containing protein n=1 Tax=unclassified Streptomyces TaxID=2593676 RepID=UPI002E182CC2|nr:MULTISPECIES: STAS domain-containing protein [unclassified Streptomyces]
MAGRFDTTDTQQRLIIEDASTEQHDVLLQLADVILRLAGELDYLTAPTLCDTVARIMAAGHRHLFLDLSAIVWCDSASLYTLLGIRSALQDADGSLTVTAASPAIHHALDSTGLHLGI